MGIDEVVNQIRDRRAAIPDNRSLLVGISGIDGSGKGYVAAQIEARLAQRAVGSVVINVDGWLNLPDKRFDRNAPAQTFYESAIRFDDFFSDLVIPLRDQRSVYLVAELVRRDREAVSEAYLPFQECCCDSGGGNLSLQTGLPKSVRFSNLG